MFLYVAKYDFDVVGCVVSGFIVLVLKDKDIIMPMVREWTSKESTFDSIMAP